jgi:hypothetical protein
VFSWLYSLFLAIDANFRLKLKARPIKDPEIGQGLAYFVNMAKFQKILTNGAHVEEVSPFTSLASDQTNNRNRSRPVEQSFTQ